MTDTEPPANDRDGRPSMPAGLADEQFAVNIRETRERKGMSQAALAAEMAERGWSWHPQTVQKAEAGQRHVRVGEAEALARILGTTIERLTWPGQEASAAALLDTMTGRAESAWEQIARWTATLEYAKYQLEVTIAETEQADCFGSARVREILAGAKNAFALAPETAVETGRQDHARMIKEGESG